MFALSIHDRRALTTFLLSVIALSLLALWLRPEIHRPLGPDPAQAATQPLLLAEAPSPAATQAATQPLLLAEAPSPAATQAAAQIIDTMIDCSVQAAYPTAYPAASPIRLDRFLLALNAVEASGRKSGVPRGDRGLARGPLQIHHSYWIDARVAGIWEYCDGWQYSQRVATAYFQRYAPREVAAGNWKSLALLHHYGVTRWRKDRSDPDGYWNKVQKALY